MKKIISIVGLTASGKTALGIRIAKEFNGEVISADSRQIYRGLDIGTAKVTRAEMQGVAHHLIDVVDAGEHFDVYEFQCRAYIIIDDILARGKLPIIVGGTGLYSRSVVEGYTFGHGKLFNCECATKDGKPFIDLAPCAPQDSQLNIFPCPASGTPPASIPRYQVLQICLMPSKEIIRPLVETRLDARIKEGMIEETRELLKKGVTAEWLQALGLEYFWNVEYIKGRISLEEYRKNLATKIMQFAKRQRTWFKKEKNTHFLTEPETFYEDTRNLVKEFI